MRNIFCPYRKHPEISQGPIFPQEKKCKGQGGKEYKMNSALGRGVINYYHQELCPLFPVPPEWSQSIYLVSEAAEGRCLRTYFDKCCCLFLISPSRGFHILFQSAVFNQAPRRGLKLITSSKCHFKSELEKKNGLLKRLFINRMTSMDGRKGPERLD